MSTSAAPVVAGATHDRPSYWSILWRLVGAWIVAWFGAGIVGATALALALPHRTGNSNGPWSIAPADRWSLVASAPIAVAWLVLITWAARRYLLEPGKGTTPGRLPVALVLGATGLLAALPRDPAGDAPNGRAIVVLLLGVLLLRRVRWAPPAPLPWSRWATLVAILALVAAAYAGTLAYGALRPLQIIDAMCSGGDPCAVQPGRTLALGFVVPNAGRGRATITGARLTGVPPGVDVLDVRRYAEGRYVPFDGPIVLRPGQAQHFAARLRFSRDGCLQGLPEAITVEGTAHGRRSTVRRSLDDLGEYGDCR